MDTILDFMRSDLFLIIIAGLNILLFITFIINCIHLGRINKNYKQFMKKLGKGEDIEEILKKYINQVGKVSEQNNEILEYCKRIDEEMKLCIQKIGMVRYSAFRDTGSDLSFALALLDDNNDGVVLNGIYSREMSNIYAKKVTGGKTENTLSEEELQAINKAMKIVK